MASSRKTVFALHGFLGSPDDWSSLELPRDWNLEPVSLKISSFEKWAAEFASSIQSEVPKIILGYSMGGRLALHALAQAPELFDGAVIVSANPGLRSEAERKLRVDADEIWAKKFLADPWDKVMSEWNGQGALRATGTPDRPEPDREPLAAMMRTWSLGRQRDLRSEIDSLTLPIEFVTGENDTKFTELTREWMNNKANGEREHTIVERAGHRVPWDAPAQFRAILANFLSRW